MIFIPLGFGVASQVPGIWIPACAGMTIHSVTFKGIYGCAVRYVRVSECHYRCKYAGFCLCGNDTAPHDVQKDYPHTRLQVVKERTAAVLISRLNPIFKPMHNVIPAKAGIQVPTIFVYEIVFCVQRGKPEEMTSKRKGG
jgi:hypothetical protein